MPGKKIKRRKSRTSLIRGFTTILVLIMVVIFGSILMVGGIFPSTPMGSGDSEHMIDESSLPNFQHDNLQLATFKFKECAAIAAVDFVVDNSGSMQGAKIQDLKDGVKAFVANYPDAGVIGLQAYNAPGNISPEGYKELVPISKMGDVKSVMSSAIDSMRAGGLTHSKDAMNFAKQRLAEGMAKYPDYNFNLVFISDGIPQTDATHQALCRTTPLDPLCRISSNTCRCFAESQDPTSVATEIKNSGVRIFTISYLDENDQYFNDRLQTLMKGVATTPDDYYLAPVTNQIQKILTQIGQKICQ